MALWFRSVLCSDILVNRCLPMRHQLCKHLGKGMCLLVACMRTAYCHVALIHDWNSMMIMIILKCQGNLEYRYALGIWMATGLPGLGFVGKWQVVRETVTMERSAVKWCKSSRYHKSNEMEENVFCCSYLAPQSKGISFKAITNQAVWVNWFWKKQMKLLVKMHYWEQLCLPKISTCPLLSTKCIILIL